MVHMLLWVIINISMDHYTNIISLVVSATLSTTS